jgi:hypothetical protein
MQIRKRHYPQLANSPLFLPFVLLIVFLMSGFSPAQETDFPVGPQYLIPPGSVLLQPIATPSSTSGSALGQPLPPAVETNFAAGPQYLIPSGSPLFLQPIATPSLSFPSGLSQAGSIGLEPTSAADPQTLLVVAATLKEQRKAFFPTVYYGIPPVNVVEIAFNEAAEREASIPSSIAGAGVVEFISPQELRERGYGVTLAEAAARWKTHALRARRVYTNDDIERLRRP